MLPQRQPSDALISWISDLTQQSEVVTISSATAKQRTQDRANELEEICNAIQEALGSGGVVQASLNAQARQGQKYSIRGGSLGVRSFIQGMSIESGMELWLSNLWAKRIYISAHGVRLFLENCRIAQVYIANGIGQTDIYSLSTTIGTLHIYKGALSHYEMQGGSLLNVVCPPPGGENPFTGTVSFKNVFFPRKRGLYVLQGPQPYRNLRHHLRSLENSQMANLIHSAELAVERDDDSWTNKVLSHLYEWMSDFGSSALRPFLWLGLLFLVSSLLILRSDGAAPAFPDASSNLVGWQTLLVDPSCGDHARAFYLALQPIVNPIGIFGPRSLLVPRHPWLAVWLSVHGVLAVVLLALLIFAIRRRFKIQQ